MDDFVLSACLAGATLTLALARLLAVGGAWASHARVAREGSPLFGRGAMNTLYAVIPRAARVAVALGLTADAVTWLSLGLGAAAGAYAALGRFGVAAWLSLLAGGADALDGFLAREAGTSSRAGEVFDTAIDRYVELALFGGLLVHYRERPVLSLVALGALSGSFMVSYVSALARSYKIEVWGGLMRRGERFAYAVTGMALCPLVGRYAPAWFDAPIAAVLGLVTVAAHGSSVARVRELMRKLRAADAVRADGA